MKRVLNKEFLEEFKSKNIVIHCKAIEQTKKLFKILNENGIKWGGSDRELQEQDNDWHTYERETCYVYEYDKGIFRGSVNYFHENNKKHYDIINFEDFIVFDKDNPRIDDLQTGMILVSKNGNLSMVLRDTASGDIVSGEIWKPLNNLYFYGQRNNESNIYDIVEVWQPTNNMGYLANDCEADKVKVGLSTNNCELLYKYDEVKKKMTLTQIEEKLGYKVEIVEG